MLLKVAAEAEDQLFISASCCVAAINNTWYDKLHPNQTRKRDILAMFCGLISLGLFAPFSVSYREVKKVRIYLDKTSICFVFQDHFHSKLSEYISCYKLGTTKLTFVAKKLCTRMGIIYPFV